MALVVSSFGCTQEICSNNIDDDGDRLIDLYDHEDCPCTTDESTLISLIPNPSFEDLNCIPTSWSQMECAQNWSQATLATSDLIHTQGHFPDFIPLPLPEGNACTGTIISAEYKEYIGTCLTGSLLKDQSYTLRFFVVAGLEGSSLPEGIEIEPIRLALFGKESCEPFPIPATLCPVHQGWTELGSVTYRATGYWRELTLEFVPTKDIETVILGAPCQLPQGLGQITQIYISWDKLHLSRTANEVIYYIPNSFTPNGDEYNQIFKPEFVCGHDPFDFSFTIYDRWGQEVFTSSDPAIGWDGTKMDFPAASGVYSWQIYYKALENSDRELLNGHVVLIR